MMHQPTTTETNSLHYGLQANNDAATTATPTTSTEPIPPRLLFSKEAETTPPQNDLRHPTAEEPTSISPRELELLADAFARLTLADSISSSSSTADVESKHSEAVCSFVQESLVVNEVVDIDDWLTLDFDQVIYPDEDDDEGDDEDDARSDATVEIVDVTDVKERRAYLALRKMRTSHTPRRKSCILRRTSRSHGRRRIFGDGRQEHGHAPAAPSAKPLRASGGNVLRLGRR
ncbi:uncharacterized protein K452DRAFT_309038 [Aplosporella prunicola CBS 121167]|uniref:Uncharacterized protein n=1 Tax=Aplosporella prunicola CBS 121167 TaxID=1176127 RepID=A0A6A6BAY0_9PEZI|nr:uncharacterized protein K452DRAFT_309038 [Aplosporella prunicola CBS 121167]KAF2141250.1 hypothetical protein K452DRAFT_309038 [Aplosporella prunicola CBS 121167]